MIHNEFNIRNIASDYIVTNMFSERTNNSIDLQLYNRFEFHALVKLSLHAFCFYVT